ncbi:MAG: hypothetical protein IK102_11530 [Treponema sp.]|nr:hypothetical protein [Treponema sp.]
MEKFTKAILDSFAVEKFQNNFKLSNIISCNDKLTKILFCLSADEYFDILQNGVSVTVTETVSRGKKIQTHFKLNGGGFATFKRPFDEYDRAIFDICNSARESGLIGITRDSIFRILTCSEHRSPLPKQATAILESVKRLMTNIEIDFSQTRDKITKYSDVPAQIISPILPCRILHNVLVNGKLTSLIQFTNESPLMTIARAKKQFITFPVELRNIANQNNTILVIMLKSYLIRRILEIKLHKQLTPAITFDDLFNHCLLSNATRWQKQDARKIVIGVLENLKSVNIIHNFELTKKGDSYYSISITF